MTYILASASPRRQELLQRVVPQFEVHPADIDETPIGNEQAHDYVERLARAKAQAIVGINQEAWVIGCDTVVVVDGHILGKPVSTSDAVAMLTALSGRTHQVMTSVVLQQGTDCKQYTEVVEVTFYPLTNSQIMTYIDSGEPLDKAGAYGIQGMGSLFVKGIQGDFYSVVGLPIGQLNQWING